MDDRKVPGWLTLGILIFIAGLITYFATGRR